jgi:hypothetical protein
VTLPQGSYPVMERRYHALAKERTMVLRCESLEPPATEEVEAARPCMSALPPKQTKWQAFGKSV